MFNSLSDSDLANYLVLLDRVDQLCHKITTAFSEEIVCRAGCSSCCRHLTLFPVEAAHLMQTISSLPDGIRVLLTQRLDWPETGTCPLLLDDHCLVYCNRPVICRTHGLPLLTETDGVRNVDYCPENFTNTDSLPGGAVINLETLNSALVAINGLFAAGTGDNRFHRKDRFTIADIILMATEKESP